MHFARHFRTGDVNLTLAKPDQFTGNKWYFGRVVFTRDSNGRISGFNVSGGRVRNLKFEKKDLFSTNKKTAFKQRLESIKPPLANPKGGFLL
jgi:hypothetical protein